MAEMRTEVIGRPRIVDQIFDRGALTSAASKVIDQGDFAACIEPGTGFLRIVGKIGRTGNQVYGDGSKLWVEYRPPSEVFHPDCIKSFDGSPITDDHPDDFVNSENFSDLCKGLAFRTRAVAFDARAGLQGGGYLLSDTLIGDEGLIQKVKGGKVQLSCGYTADVLDRPGVGPDGSRHDRVQMNIRGNHVAVVDEGRAGPQYRLLPRADAEDIVMKIKKLKDGKTAIQFGDIAVNFEGQEVEIPDAILMMAAKVAAELGPEATPEMIMRGLMEALGMAMGGDEGAEGNSNGSEEPMDQPGSGQSSAPAGSQPTINIGRGDGASSEEKMSKESIQKMVDSAVSAEVEKRVSHVDKNFRRTLRIVSDARLQLGDSYDYEGKSNGQIILDMIADLDPERAGKYSLTKDTDEDKLAVHLEWARDASSLRKNSEPSDADRWLDANTTDGKGASGVLASIKEGI